jgi:serine phosphatase RsbU (regulator of sigma subunit)
LLALRQRRLANKELELKNLQITRAKDEIETKSFELKDAMDHIQLQNKSIMQSINYAQRIQDAMLPKQIGMQTLIPDSFIFFKPRDVVSGDFYWFEDINKQINGNKNEKLEGPRQSRKIFLAAVDCTGHGVPGAFMSMLGFNLLNDIVRRGVHDSDKILNNLHEGIRKSLNQDETQNRDGMDMALCVIDPVNKIMEFSGAQNPLLYVQDGQLYRVKANKFPVGGFQLEDHNFSKQIINIDKPTTFYIFSDGFTDQFGGPNGRKFMAKNFRDLLYEIYEMPMTEQKKILELVLNEWMGINEQTDDVLVMGFKIDLENNPVLL